MNEITKYIQGAETQNGLSKTAKGYNGYIRNRVATLW